jgi:pimeloyl-ACP methyl ester carboxylesterase
VPRRASSGRKRSEARPRRPRRTERSAVGVGRADTTPARITLSAYRCDGIPEPTTTHLRGLALLVVGIALGCVVATRWTTRRPRRDRVAIATGAPVLTALVENHGVGLSFPEVLGVHGADPELAVCDRCRLYRGATDRRAVDDELKATTTSHNVPHMRQGTTTNPRHSLDAIGTGTLRHTRGLDDEGRCLRRRPNTDRETSGLSRESDPT